MNKLMVSAGEVSGDIQGYYLICELKKNLPNLAVFGMGGEMMRSAGADIIVDIRKRGTIGLIETIKHLPYTAAALFKMKKMLKTEKPDALLLIDSQGFNMPLAQFAKKLGIKTIYYIAPQEWLWGTDKGLKKVADAIGLIIAVFEKEYRAYKKFGANVCYFGNPAVDFVKVVKSKETMLAELGISGKRPIIGLLPGSREQEMRIFLPILMQSSEIISRKFPNAYFLLPVSSRIFQDEIDSKIPKNYPIKISKENRFDVMNSCDLLIAASGTVLIEGICLGIPMIMIYKLSKLTEFVARRLLKIKLPFFSMPNLLAKRAVIPELVQDDCKPDFIAETAIGLLNNFEKIGLMKEDISQIRSKLGSSGVIKNIAKQIVNFISI